MSKIDQLIAEFTVALRQAIAEEAAAAFAQVASGGGGTIPTPFRKKPGPKPRALKIAAPTKKGGKRTAEDIAQQGTLIHGFLKKHPASNSETIGSALGMSAGEMALPMAKLIADKAVSYKGERRGRKYSAK